MWMLVSAVVTAGQLPPSCPSQHLEDSVLPASQHTEEPVILVLSRRLRLFGGMHLHCRD